MRLYRSIVPRQIRSISRYLYKNTVYLYRFFILLLNTYLLNGELKIIIGAALTRDSGWLSTNEIYLDITRENHWRRAFRTPNRISRIVSEHVFEHLTNAEMKCALKCCYMYLQEGGSLLIAVPDGNHPNELYRRNTGINGHGADAQDHKQFITYESLSTALLENGFTYTLIEGFYNGQLVSDYARFKKFGLIHRSRSTMSGQRSDNEGWNFPDAQTSLIVLAEK